MKHSQHQLVAAVTCEDQVEPALARCALRNRWTIFDARIVLPIAKHVLLAQPRVLVVQLPHASDPMAGQMVGLLSRLSRHWTPMILVALASGDGSEGQDSEMVARQSGADCFLSSPCSEVALEDALESLAPGILASSQEAIPRVVRSGAHNVHQSLSRRVGRGA